MISFTKTESVASALYAELPLLEITLKNDPIVIPTPSVSVMIGGTSLPYSFDLEALNAIPHSQVIFKLTVDNPSTSKLSISGTQSLIFTPNLTKQGFLLKIDSTATVSDTPTFTLSL